MSLTPEQTDLHNRLYEDAWKLGKEEIQLDGRVLSKPGFFARRRLHKCQRLIQQVLEIHPANWSAMFLLGKIEQRFGNENEALKWFLKAREFEPVNTSLAKEASLTASRLGDQSLAVRIVDEAIAVNPKDAALRVNSGLAHLLAGQPGKAAERFKEAVELEPTSTNEKLELYAKRVVAGVLPLPRTEADIIAEV